MRRTSFAGALLVIAIGAVLAFAVHGSPRALDLRTAGVILILGGAGDLMIRSLIADSPLLSRQTADVAAVVDGVGEPVLDVAGSPIALPTAAAYGQARPALIAPLPGTMPPGSGAETIVVTDEYGVAHLPGPAPTAASPMPAAPSSADPGANGGSAYSSYESAVRAEVVDPLDTPESPVAVTTLTGRPVRPRGRGLRSRRSRG